MDDYQSHLRVFHVVLLGHGDFRHPLAVPGGIVAVGQCRNRDSSNVAVEAMKIILLDLMNFIPLVPGSYPR